MAETPDERLHRIIDTVEVIAMEGAAAVRDSTWMPQEIAAALAEKVACQDIPNAEHRSEEWVDAWVAACEACAAVIRDYQPIRNTKHGA